MAEMTKNIAEDTLWKFSENVNDWLKFAECKNAAVITFAAVELAILKMFDRISGMLLILIVAILGLSLIISLWSFLPKMNIPWWSKFYSERIVKSTRRIFSNAIEKTLDDDNLLFFGHVTKYSINEYISMMEKHMDTNISNNRLLSDLCGQIVTNSGIAYRKYKFFQASCICLFIVQIILFSAIGYYYA